jgi:hypothetical protein
MNRSILRLGIVACALMFVRASHADEKSACIDASEQGQRLRAAHELVEARAQFLVCAARHCPSIVQQLCDGWLAEVENSLPTVVLTAKSALGADLVDVVVTVDGRSLLTKLEGQASPVNPGRHIFHFSLADGTQLDQQVVVKEGEKNQGIAVSLGSKLPRETMRHGRIEPPGPPPAAALSGQGSGPWATVGWGMGGVGIAGLGVGTVFGLLAVSDDHNAHCNAQNQCLPGPLSQARSAALASDIGFIAGGVLVAAGGALVLFAPKKGPEGGSVRVNLAPAVGARTGGITLGGSF